MGGRDSWGVMSRRRGGHLENWLSQSFQLYRATVKYLLEILQIKQAGSKRYRPEYYIHIFRDFAVLKG